ncbi:unnamed protein product [Arctogadus glacialis]
MKSTSSIDSSSSSFCTTAWSTSSKHEHIKVLKPMQSMVPLGTPPNRAFRPGVVQASLIAVVVSHQHIIKKDHTKEQFQYEPGIQQEKRMAERQTSSELVVRELW